MDGLKDIGKWHYEEILGKGGFGIVMLWRDKESGDLIALKQCRWGADPIMTTTHRERWKNEVDIMLKLDHPTIVTCMPVPEEFTEVVSGDLPLLCMEYCTGHDLRQTLNRPENCCGLREASVRSILMDISSAINYLHGLKIIHRDLKPENIVLQDVDGRIVYKLIDLGYAKELHQTSACMSFVGTMQYLAPELFYSNRYSCTVDYWSLGLVTHEVVTGRRPFLPEMPSPGEWFPHVRKKSPQDICISQTPEGLIEYKTGLLPENHISCVFQKYLEGWLQIMLEWDPKKRGRSTSPAYAVKHQNSDTPSDTLVVFDLLNHLLQIKVVSIFSVSNCKWLYYEITDNMTYRDLQEKLLVDTGIKPDNQLLLLPRGTLPNPNKDLAQLWAPPEEDVWNIFLFHHSTTPMKPENPDIPPLVTKLLREPRLIMQYSHQRRVTSHAVFFLQQQADVYKLLLQAQQVHMQRLLSQNATLQGLAARLNTELLRQQSRHKMFVDSLQLDLDLYKDQAAAGGITSNQMINSWNSSENQSAKMLHSLEERTRQLEESARSINIRILELQRSPFSQPRNAENLNSVLEQGVKLYEDLKKRTKEERSVKRDSADVGKVVYRCLKQRNKLLSDYYQHLEKAAQCLNEVDQLLVPMEELLTKLVKSGKEVMLMQEKRQKEIWNLIVYMTKQFERQVISDSNPSNTPHAPDLNSPPLPTPELPSGPPSAMSFILDRSTEETRDIINENYTIRLQMQNYIDEAWQSQMRLINDDPYLSAHISKT